MQVEVLYFAALRDRLGLEREALSLEVGATVGDLVRALEERHEYLRGLKGFRVAVNQAFAREDQEVPEGAEVALIPPVSGGAGDEGDTVRLTREPIRSEDLWDLVDDPASGAVAVFLGVVRDHHEGRRVLHLEYQAYEGMAEKELRRVAARVREEHPEVRRLVLVHRFGDLRIGEASVGVAVSTPHRADAFAACRLGIDAIKESVPIWKREHYEDGEPEWVRADCMHHG